MGFLSLAMILLKNWKFQRFMARKKMNWSLFWAELSTSRARNRFLRKQKEVKDLLAKQTRKEEEKRILEKQRGAKESFEKKNKNGNK